MKKYNETIRKMSAGECLLIDGATATEMERRGVPQLKNAWNGGGAMSHPDILKDIHKSYILSGAKVVISNTFATCKHTLEDAQEVHNFEKLNADAVKLAKAACSELGKEDVLVAGGISYWSFTGNHPSLFQLKSNISEQAQILADSGAELLMLEMMVDIDRMLVTLQAALETNLPVWVGLSCHKNQNNQICLLNGEPLEKAVKSLTGTKVDLISIMHTDVDYVEECLEILSSEWTGLTGVYAHSGQMKDGDWTFNDVIGKEEYSRHVSSWIQRGVNLVGGCCGITTDHMHHISKEFF
jgi:S-methylmethionine-dependent homocysteine/selenocysteine methylase